MRKQISLLLVTLVTLGLTAMAAAADQITVKGSDTMVLIAQRWAEAYMKANPGTTIQVTGGGSGTGISAIIEGTCNIANSSRPIKASELAKGKDSGKNIVEHKVALDALVVVVHPSNTVKELSVPQLKAIFTGAVTNWNQVGGSDSPIVIYSRESNSGTYGFFKEHILSNADFTPTALYMPGTAAIKSGVSKDPKAIGYGGAAYFAGKGGTKIIPIKQTKDSAAINPIKADGHVDEEKIRSLEYPIARYLYCYTVGQPSGALKKYLDWMVGTEGQKYVRAEGYVPLVDVK